MSIKGGSQDFLVAGYLNSPEDIRFGDGDHAYTKLTLLSEIPYSIDREDSPYENKISFYISNLQDIFIDDENDSEESRKGAIWKFLHNQIIIVRPIVEITNDRIYYKGKQPTLRKMNAEFNPLDARMVMIPQFSTNNTNPDIQSKIDFENSLVEQKVIGRLKEPWSHESDDNPDAVLWNDDGQLTLYGVISNQSYTTTGEIAFRVDNGSLKKTEINTNDDAWYGNQYTCDDVVFIDKAALISELNRAVTSVKPTNLEQDSRFGVIDKNSKYSKDKPNLSKPVENISELDFLDRLRCIVDREKLYYEQKDLVNFHTAMKSDGLVILSGLSGTGKSQLALAYARALQIPDKNVEFIPVRPYWADDSDLIGFADTINSVYRPGDSGLVDILLDAEKNSDQLYMVVFDEMNLARVEHYFSQFLSVLEMKPDSRKIKLYNKELESRMYNNEKYPSSITIKSNVLFVGTVNTDESTYQFSDKVLDRANVINLKMIPFFKTPTTSANFSTHDKNTRITLSKYSEFKNCSKNNALTTEEKRMLWEIQEELNSVDKNIGIGWRIVKQIDGYLCNLPDTPKLTRPEAIDMQLNQRVWTKLRGSEKQLKGLLGSVDTSGNVVPGQLEKTLDSYPTSSDFKESKSTIRRKVKELDVYGFTN